MPSRPKAGSLAARKVVKDHVESNQRAGTGHQSVDAIRDDLSHSKGWLDHCPGLKAVMAEHDMDGTELRSALSKNSFKRGWVDEDKAMPYLGIFLADAAEDAGAVAVAPQPSPPPAAPFGPGSAGYAELLRKVQATHGTAPPLSQLCSSVAGSDEEEEDEYAPSSSLARSNSKPFAMSTPSCDQQRGFSLAHLQQQLSPPLSSASRGNKKRGSNYYGGSINIDDGDVFGSTPKKHRSTLMESAPTPIQGNWTNVKSAVDGIGKTIATASATKAKSSAEGPVFTEMVTNIVNHPQLMHGDFKGFAARQNIATHSYNRSRLDRELGHPTVKALDGKITEHTLHYKGLCLKIGGFTTQIHGGLAEVDGHCEKTDEEGLAKKDLAVAGLDRTKAADKNEIVAVAKRASEAADEEMEEENEAADEELEAEIAAAKAKHKYRIAANETKRKNKIDAINANAKSKLEASVERYKAGVDEEEARLHEAKAHRLRMENETRRLGEEGKVKAAKKIAELEAERDLVLVPLQAAKIVRDTAFKAFGAYLEANEVELDGQGEKAAEHRARAGKCQAAWEKMQDTYAKGDVDKMKKDILGVDLDQL